MSRPLRPSPRSRTAAALLLPALALGSGGCESLRGEPSVPAHGRHVATVQGFLEPESAKYDAAQDAWFVSSIVGYGSGRDNDAYISRVDGAGFERNEVFVRSGRNGVELHAPKGMVLQGDTLWVADIDVLRGFQRLTGAPVANVDFSSFRAVMLNGVTLGPAGEVIITDTGIHMTDKGVVFAEGSRIFAMGPGRTVRVLAEGEWLIHPNGIAWEPGDGRFVVASFNAHVSEVYALRPGDTTRTTIVKGPGRYDGLTRIGEGQYLTTSWPDSAVYLIEGDRTRRIGGSIWTPADIGYDARRRIVAVPSVLMGRVEFWELP